MDNGERFAYITGRAILDDGQVCVPYLMRKYFQQKGTLDLCDPYENFFILLPCFYCFVSCLVLLIGIVGILELKCMSTNMNNKVCFLM